MTLMRASAGQDLSWRIDQRGAPNSGSNGDREEGWSQEHGSKVRAGTRTRKWRPSTEGSGSLAALPSQVHCSGPFPPLQKGTVMGTVARTFPVPRNSLEGTSSQRSPAHPPSERHRSSRRKQRHQAQRNRLLLTRASVSQTFINTPTAHQALPSKSSQSGGVPVVGSCIPGAAGHEVQQGEQGGAREGFRSGNK